MQHQPNAKPAPDPTPLSTATELDALTQAAVARVRRWLRLAAAHPGAGASQEARLSAILSDPNGLTFTSAFVDRVIRLEDAHAAADALEYVATLTPATMLPLDRLQISLGATLAQVAPQLVIPAARARLRQMVGHMVVDARPQQFGRTVAALKAQGHRLNINLLGEAVLGENEADHHLTATLDLLARDDVDYVSVKVSSIASRINMWAYPDTVNYVLDRLRPLYRHALTLAGSTTQAAHGTKFINLDMEEYRDLNLTLDVFTRLLSEDEFRHLEAGIVIQAYLPDALAAIQRLATFAAERVGSGGAGIKVRLVKGANLSMENVHAQIAGWPLTVWDSKEATDANYKRILHWLLTQDSTPGLRLGVAGHNLFDIAFAYELAATRGALDRIEFEMLQGMATALSDTVAHDVGDLLLYVPAVHPNQFDAAVSYLVRRLEENSAPQNFMSTIFDIRNGNAAFRTHEDRFRQSMTILADTVAAHGSTPPAPNRTQSRVEELGATTSAIQEAIQTETTEITAFANEPDTDISLPANQEWARAIVTEASQPGWLDGQPVAEPIDTVEGIDALVRRATDSPEVTRWRSMSARERLEVFERAARIFAANRGRFLGVMAAEAGKLLSQSDPEVSEAIDFIRYYARRAVELDELQRGEAVRFEVDRLIVITPPWNFPVAIPTGGTVAALSVGAAAILKPAPAAARCGALIAQCLWEAGVPREVLQVAPPVEGELGKRLVAHPAVDRVILTGASDTAALFRSFRADLHVNAETSGKNAIVVTPSADRDLAVADLVASAFGHTGQKCSAASLGIFVGSVYESERYRRQLVDAVESLVVDEPWNLRAEMGPLTVDVSHKLHRALTTLDDGEEWLVEPRLLDDGQSGQGGRGGQSGRLWSPGVKIGVKPGSFFHLTECFGPVLGIMEARDLDHAIELQNAVDFGLTAGIHSLDTREVATWLDRVQAGNAYVNRGITGAIVQRQPFGGWKRSSVGLGSKAGGPNYQMMLGRWHDQAATTSAITDWLTKAKESDQRAYATEFGVAHDPTGLGAEANIFRYRPRFVTLRVSAGVAALSAEVVAAYVERCTHAARLVGAGYALSVDPAVAEWVGGAAGQAGGVGGTAKVTVQTAQEFAEDVATGRVDDTVGARVRMIGPVEEPAVQAAAGRAEVTVLTDPITASGRVELRMYVQEQAVSMTVHRFGNPDPAFCELRDTLMGQTG